jgi:hypothetical protein
MPKRTAKINHLLITAIDRLRTGKGRTMGSYLYYSLKSLSRHSYSPRSFLRLAQIVKYEGLKGVAKRLLSGMGNSAPGLGRSIVLDDYKDPYAAYNIVPFYVNQQLDSETALIEGRQSICIHLHSLTARIAPKVLIRLSRIPIPFDLLITIPQGCQEPGLRAELSERLPRAKRILIEEVAPQHQAYDLVAMVKTFGTLISDYAIVGHFSCAEAPEMSLAERLIYDTVHDHLLGPIDGSGGRIVFFLRELQTRAKIIIAERELKAEQGPEVDRTVRGLVFDLIGNGNGFSMEDFPHLEHPEKGMFWARTECIKGLLAISLDIDGDKSLAHYQESQLNQALNRAVMLSAIPYVGRFLRITKGDALKDYRYFECQQDYRGSIVHDDIKVLSYYLPQFHPIPENDEWHGKGFTEWTKVCASTPLFMGHYQQHIPHSDIGYYKIDSPETLHLQAGLMNKAGVHGQIFYHYWFGGKLILEEPARILLTNPEIPMPFCFCWANENWTRRWDGNNEEMLLAQSYSENDARDFIKYLLPFFRDGRYIKVDQRPVLLIYRPACIPNISRYLDIWKEECQAAGLATPYLVAVLTRGATSPVDFGMDAGAERVLHDWTQGAVQDITHALTTYEPFEGSILPYKDVSNFYIRKNDTTDYDYFQSLIPMWDNSARYGKNAYIVHGSTPELFQIWLEELIEKASQRLPADRRFILINAWNEWSEGAHLEPDSQYGYSYLNSVGRALSALPCQIVLDPGSASIANLRIHVCFGQELLAQFKEDGELASRCLYGLLQSPLTQNIFVSPEQQLAVNPDSAFLIGSADDADLVFEFRRSAVFSTQLLGLLVETALGNENSVVIPNIYGSDEDLVIPATNGSVHEMEANQSPIHLYSPSRRDLRRPRFVMQANALCFIAEPNTIVNSQLPQVTVIIRIHKDGNLSLLENALGCLCAMQNCICLPLIAAQDLTKEQADRLNLIVNRFEWHRDFRPQVKHYASHLGRGDLRSKMLNESLQVVNTKYAAFLDYDDLLMPFAYDLLIGKMQAARKLIAFGRVYRTLYDTSRSLIIDRARQFEYGYDYSDFIAHNSIPLHSFIMDVEGLCLEHVVWSDDQMFMEDYFLTLQLFTASNADWRGLRDNTYVGDYVHSIDRAHTLAILDDDQRDRLHANEDYLRCLQRVQGMQRQQADALKIRSRVVP